jgi:hypothetical protein
VRAEVARREREIDDALRTSSQARKLAEELQRTVAPYEQMIRASNSTPLQAIQNLMQTAASLRTAPAPQKAQMIAQLIGEYGVDINMLDQALQGRANQPQPDVERLLEQRLQPFQQLMQDIQQQRQQSQERTAQEAQSALESFFNDPANEYAHDVRMEMADLLEVSAKRGQQMSLQDAYKRATLLHPQIAQLMSQKQLQQQASQQTAAAQRAKQASASVPSMGAPSQSEDDTGDSIRSALVASMKSLSR